jgi:arylsulfatase A-like enzyme
MEAPRFTLSLLRASARGLAGLRGVLEESLPWQQPAGTRFGHLPQLRSPKEGAGMWNRGYRVGRIMLLQACAALMLLTCACRKQSDAPANQPMNVLFIMSDQHNAHALGCYGNGYGGATPSMTPNLDKLAREGVRFTNAFSASPQCCASRYSILTGRWPHNHGLRWNGIWEPRGPATFPALFRAAGYETATIGKHHMMWLDYMPEPLVEDYGFNRVIDFADYVSYCASQQQEVSSQSGNYWSMQGLPLHLQLTGYTSNINQFHTPGYTANEVMRFLEECAAPGGPPSPFVCFYSMFLPHTPVLPGGPADPQDWAHTYHPPSQLKLPPNQLKIASTEKLAEKQANYASVTNAEWQEVLSYYYGLVLQIDWNIGRVLQRLEELGLDQNTLVIYTSDHGDMASEMRCWEKGSGLYDATTRVPLIMRLPGVLPPQTTSDALVSTLDLFPTVAELAGVPVPDDVRDQLDGRSLVDLILSGEPRVDWRNEVFSESGSPKLPSILRSRMVRTKTAKYTYFEQGGQEEFYDLSLDPFEIDNLIDDPNPSVQLAIDDLRGRLDKWWNGEEGHAPIYEASGEGPLPPVRVGEPDPPSGAQGVARDVDPAWLPSTAAESQQVFFGTDPLALMPFKDLCQMEQSFNPGSLAPLTTFYWRVDSSNAHGATPGPVWSFTTAAGGSSGPGLATSPTPAHRARDVAASTKRSESVGLRTTLSWNSPSDAVSQDLYLGLEGRMQLVAAGLSTEATSHTTTVEAGRTYHWRVDTINAQGKTEGDVWIFETTDLLLPEPARPAFPQHMGRSSQTTLRLEWFGGQGATSHDVYFGTSFPLAFVGNQIESHFQAGPLAPGQTYYWRIDEVNSFGARPGWIWRFTVE